MPRTIVPSSARSVTAATAASRVHASWMPSSGSSGVGRSGGRRPTGCRCRRPRPAGPAGAIAATPRRLRHRNHSWAGPCRSSCPEWYGAVRGGAEILTAPERLLIGGLCRHWPYSLPRCERDLDDRRTPVGRWDSWAGLVFVAGDAPSSTMAPVMRRSFDIHDPRHLAGLAVAVAMWVLVVVLSNPAIDVSDPFSGQVVTAQDARSYYGLNLADLYTGRSDWNTIGAYPYSPAFAQLVYPLDLLPWPVFVGAWTAILIARRLLADRTGPVPARAGGRGDGDRGRQHHAAAGGRDRGRVHPAVDVGAGDPDQDHAGRRAASGSRCDASGGRSLSPWARRPWCWACPSSSSPASGGRGSSC